VYLFQFTVSKHYHIQIKKGTPLFSYLNTGGTLHHGFNFRSSIVFFPFSLRAKTSFASSCTVSDLNSGTPSPTISVSGPTVSHKFGLCKAAIDILSCVEFMTALCSMLLYFPLVNIYKKNHPELEYNNKAILNDSDTDD
jgi:hypothetical protein